MPLGIVGILLSRQPANRLKTHCRISATIVTMKHFLFGIITSLLLFSSLTACAQEEDSALLSQPEAALFTWNGPGSFALQVDGQPLSLASPHILIHKTTDEADFISAEPGRFPGIGLRRMAEKSELTEEGRPS